MSSTPRHVQSWTGNTTSPRPRPIAEGARMLMTDTTDTRPWTEAEVS
ncbi:MAG: hypothetical protein QOH56_1333 [Pseudonocardiales bacterium]|jgi:hypothetical protein|nr:hypothetical protein [Frankiales bacterium]MDQ1735082.1 hypothetical protein [Pseudonocardiales bacterium]